MNRIHAADLTPSWLKSFADCRVLSLDCFDTLFWRSVAEPHDVFFALESNAAFSAAGLNASLRSRAERMARRRSWLLQGHSEVSLEAIYEEALPTAQAALIQQLVEAEVQAEIAGGYLFEPVVTLMRAAKARGMQVVIVSDTYFNAQQLKRLLFARLPELEGCIDHVFCSVEQASGKTGDIWKAVGACTGVAAQHICHLGDNLLADVSGAQRHGVQATHFIQYTADIQELLAQRQHVAMQMLPALRQSEALPSPFHGMLARQGPQDVEALLGYGTLGPILFGFAQFITEQARELAAQGATVKIAFLLRDGFLPGRACEALAGAGVGHYVSINRFTSTAASFDNEDKVIMYLQRNLSRDSFADIARQLLLPGSVADRLIRQAQLAVNPEMEFVQLIREPQLLTQIFNASAAFRGRLLTHLQRTCDLAAGDTLMLVDLGYNGTVQTNLQGLIKQALKVDVQGRYLISEATQAGQSANRKGLLDSNWLDRRAIATLLNYIPALEMMCTQNMPATLDYAEDGSALLDKAVIHSRQHDVVEAVQAECLRFIEDVSLLPQAFRPLDNPQALAISTTVELARFLYFPLPAEVACLASFKFDYNLGTDKVIALCDVDAALTGLRRQGFSYMSEVQARGRTNYPHELRHVDLSHANLLFSQNRFGFEVRTTQASFRKEVIPLLVIKGQEHFSTEATAQATHDGYFALWVPQGGGVNIGVLLGKKYRWIQIESLEQVSAEKGSVPVDLLVGQQVILDGFQGQGSGLFQLTDEAMMFFPAQANCAANQFRRIVFRPVVAA